MVLFILLILSACKSTETAVESTKEVFRIEITFSTEEAIKMIPYEHQTIELRLDNALEEHGQYAATIRVFPDQAQQTVEKLALQDGVGNVRLIGPIQGD